MSVSIRTRVALAFAVAAAAVAVWAVSAHERSTAARVFDESQAANRMLTAMLDQSTGLHGFAITRDQQLLQPFNDGVRDFDAAVEDARSFADGDDGAAIDGIVASADRWRASAEREVARVGDDTGARADRAGTRDRKRLFDDVRGQLTTYIERLADDRRADLARARDVSLAAIVLLSVLLGGSSLYLVERRRRLARLQAAAEREYRRTQSEFVQAMQIMRDEPEAHALVREHLERSIPGSDVLVLNRSDSDNRLTASTPLADDSPLARQLVDAEPESCLAVRLGRQYERTPDSEPLLACELCGASASEIVCTPSLVGGEVIGSVLVRGERPLGDEERERIADSVSQAAPSLANLRNLAIARDRAATDALTGLPNSRSCRDSLKRMVAHAGRAVTPLSAVMLDLDRFKQINDRFGHGAGDDVLVGVGEAIVATLRESDFGGRYGGEEFLLLLPGTNHEGALAVAETLREAIGALEFEQIELHVTASFGIASYPFDALDADALIRAADRALYAAKAAGRNRVVLTP